LPSKLMMVQNKKMTPTPAMTPPLALSRSEFANVMILLATSSCPFIFSRICAATRSCRPNPLATPNISAITGTIESSKKKVSADALNLHLFSLKPLTARTIIRTNRMTNDLLRGWSLRRIRQISVSMNFIHFANITSPFLITPPKASTTDYTEHQSNFQQRRTLLSEPPYQSCRRIKKGQTRHLSLRKLFNSGGRIRTCDLRVMGLIALVFTTFCKITSYELTPCHVET
jgi:hypothetical protein